MRVHVDAPWNLSRAMFRVAKALRAAAPAHVECVADPDEADVHVRHVIGYEALDDQAPDIAVIQYCIASALAAPGEDGAWAPLWRRARAVWSYYDLSRSMPPGARFYLAPLGVDGETFRHRDGPRPVGVMTSGYVSGPGAEAIEEMVVAAGRAGLTACHLGPTPTNLRAPLGPHCLTMLGVPDETLAAEYAQCKWVSGLRYVEGFELPVIEGLACGARPIVFDRPDMRRWYDGHAVFVPELEGDALVDVLTDVLRSEPEPVTLAERAEVLRRFDWFGVARGFWDALLERKGEAAA